jgi:hypothetical protein
MQRFLFRSVLALGLVTGGLVGGSRLAGQEPPRQRLPKAEDLLDREAKARGGKKAHQKVKTVFMKLTISGPDMKQGHVIYHAGPNKHYQEVTVEGIGTTEVVVSGDMAWVKDSITGSQFLKGKEKTAAFRGAAEFAKTYQQVGTWRKEYKQVRTVAEEKINGKTAYKVQLTTKEGSVRFHHYDKQSGLLVREETTVGTPQGKVARIGLYSDWRKVDGLVLPFRVKIVVGSAEFVGKVERIKHNMDIPKERFTLPAELQKRQKQK